MQCPLCGKGEMTERKATLLWKCTECGAKLLADVEHDSAEGLWRSEQAYKALISKKGGGSKTGGNRMKRKKPVKKTPQYFLE